MLGFINNLKKKLNMQVQYLFCNSTGKIVVFKKICKQVGLGADFEYTFPGMSQQNGCIKQKFTTFSTGYDPCSMVVSLMLLFKIAPYEPKL